MTWAISASLVLCLASAGCSATQGSSDLPDAAERFPTPLELASARTECLQGKGWLSELDESTAQIGTPIPTGSEKKFEDDDAACYKELGVDPDRELTDTEYDVLYDQYQKGKDCLQDEGHVISEPPSRQVFQETYQDDPWLPWIEVDEADTQDALVACPMPPPVY